MQNQNNPSLILWIAWLAMFSGAMMIGVMVGGTPFQEEVQINIPIFVVCILLAAGSIGLRLLIIPKAKSAQALFPMFMIGCAMGEAITVLGAAMSPQVWPVFAGLTVLVMLCYLPLYLPKGNTQPEA